MSRVEPLLKNEDLTLQSIFKSVTCERSEPKTLARVAELTRHVDNVDALRGLGVKLYYGDTKVDSKAEAGLKARTCARDLLNHVILGLASIQHCGNMVIKMHEAQDPFTVGLIFALYNLF